jgi:hypothetical protein
MAGPLSVTQDFQRQMSPKAPPRPSPTFYASPLVPQHETAARAKLDQEAAARLLRNITESSGSIDERRTKTWLEFQHVTTTAI